MRPKIDTSILDSVGQWRVEAHIHFDRLWRHGFMTRKEAYNWLREEMNLPRHKCHMRKMSISQCKQVIEMSKEKLEELRT